MPYNFRLTKYRLRPPKTTSYTITPETKVSNPLLLSILPLCNSILSQITLTRCTCLFGLHSIHFVELGISRENEQIKLL